ncbi:MAG: putative bifunctional protein: putative binding protein and filamentation induced by cAMP [Crocinitomicaceae bacterium]|jgi:Fic family protein/DNA-binding XRE family transcriptional regulator|nr:putative bifunctional protein: putative binding protein and filamentation induced by cAMP [Crocinitomicaceae bacterium]
MKNLLKKARLEKALKVKELAALLQVDQSMISRFESGKRIPTEAQLHLLAKYLDLPINDLLVAWLKERVISELKPYPVAMDVISMVQEEMAKYNVAKKRIISKRIRLILDEIDSCKAQLDNKRKYDSYRIKEALELEYIYDSNRIEGNTLTLRETDLVVNKGLTISGKSMQEHLEAINHKEAITYIHFLIDKNAFITEREVLSIHNLILRGINSAEAGKYRNANVMIQGSKHTPPSYLELRNEMDLFFSWYEKYKDIHPVVLAAELHERLVTIHPFIDGNGRTSRLLMNLVLLKNGYVIANLKGDYEARMNYYNALEEAQVNENKDDFIELIALTELECIKRYLSILQ